MDRKELKERLAPCGLDCARCVMKRDGEISRHAAELMAALEGFSAFAARGAAMNPVFAGYPQFEAMLGFFAGAACGGCRNDNRCGMPGCAAKVCAAERGIDFCGECPEFPCTRNTYPESLAGRWLAMGRRIAEIGAQAYYAEQVTRPRY
jgi:hypothetical protein